jgi:hypothetical protein
VQLVGGRQERGLVRCPTLRAGPARDPGDLLVVEAGCTRVLDVLAPLEGGPAVPGDAEREKLVVPFGQRALERERRRPAEERGEEVGLAREDRDGAGRLATRRRGQR